MHTKNTIDQDELAEILGPGVEKIADCTPDNARRLRHLIARHNFPAFQIGGRWYARRSDVNQYYSNGRAGQ
jgi:hypothetical protein